MENIRTNAAVLEEQIGNYQRELQSEPMDTLSSEEQEQLTQNIKEIERLKQQMMDIAAAKAQAATEINAKKDMLNNDLKRRRQELLSKKDRSVANSSVSELSRKKKEEQSVSRKIEKISKRIAGTFAKSILVRASFTRSSRCTELERDMDAGNERLEQINQSIEKLRVRSCCW